MKFFGWFKVKTGGLYQEWYKREGKMLWLGQFVYKGKKYRTKPYDTKTQAKDALDLLRVEVRQQLRRQVNEKSNLVKFAEELPMPLRGTTMDENVIAKQVGQVALRPSPFALRIFKGVLRG